MLLLVLSLSTPLPASGQSLRGSPDSLQVQLNEARISNFTFLASGRQVRNFVAAGYLVPVRPNADLQIHGVSFRRRSPTEWRPGTRCGRSPARTTPRSRR
jgi:hypothetical protein